MPKRHPQSHATPDHQPKRDFELCKVVFSAAISQILYARRAFPPECFQLLPLREVVARSFDDIIASGTEIKSYDKELLRDQGSTVFLRQGSNYGLNRFLGILRGDIFPLIETEGLVKFRINYLQKRIWQRDCLVEYYTVALQYEPNGTYELDIWRAGTGKQHIARTECQLWNLGDYLSRLSPWTDSLHWTLAFHATERPDDPPIGVWKFDRSEFDEANMELQQRRGYTYARVVRLEVSPSSPPDDEDVVLETSPELEADTPIHRSPEERRSRAVEAAQTRRNRTRGQKPGPASNTRSSTSRRKGVAAAHLSPPRTLTSSRNSSKSAAVENGQSMDVVAGKAGNEMAEKAKVARKPAYRAGLVTKRKPKRPLQLFENAASSLPPTQIIGESQSLGQSIQAQNDNSEWAIESRTQGLSEDDILGSPSFDPHTLLDGISLSPETMSVIQGTPNINLPRLPLQSPSTQHHQLQETTGGEPRSLLRLRPSSSVVGAPPGLSQWEPQASPPGNLLGIALSDAENYIETASEAEPETSPERQSEPAGDKDITFDFEPNTVERRASLFYDSLSSNGEEE